MRYADDLVVMCKSKQQCEEAERRIKDILVRLGLELHPDKTRRVELYDGKQGFDFLGCHFRKRLSGKIWEHERKRVYFLHRQPSQPAPPRHRGRWRNLDASGAAVKSVMFRDDRWLTSTVPWTALEWPTATELGEVLTNFCGEPCNDANGAAITLDLAAQAPAGWTATRGVDIGVIVTGAAADATYRVDFP